MVPATLINNIATTNTIHKSLKYIMYRPPLPLPSHICPHLLRLCSGDINPELGFQAASLLQASMRAAA